jgi:hypothetical protein
MSTPAPTPLSKESKNLISCGYIFAVIMPIIGLILGLVTITRPEQAISKHGLKVIMLSVVAFIIWYKILASSASHATYHIYYRTYE